MEVDKERVASLFIHWGGGEESLFLYISIHVPKYSLSAAASCSRASLSRFVPSIFPKSSRPVSGSVAAFRVASLIRRMASITSLFLSGWVGGWVGG